MIRQIVFSVVVATLGSGAAQASELRDYGEYLAGECTSCHKLDGTNNNIPNIVGWDAENFITILKTYTNGERDNKAMKSVVQQLDEEQMKALATYFASLEPK